jgi:hypothetical protein
MPSSRGNCSVFYVYFIIFILLLLTIVILSLLCLCYHMITITKVSFDTM